MNEERRVAIVYPFGNLDSVPSLQNTALLLARHGYLVDIFTKLDAKHLKPQFLDERIAVFPLKAGSLRTWSGFSRYLTGTVCLPVRVQYRHAKTPYRCVIGVDPTGLVAAAGIAKQVKAPLVYYSLELLLSYELVTDRQRDLKAKEKILSRHSAFVIIQDEERAALLSSDNELPPKHILCVPNAPLGEARFQRSDYLRHRFGLPERAKIILNTGSLADWTGADGLMRSTWDWPDDWVLICHTRFRSGHAFGEYLKTLQNLAKPGQVLFSTDPLPYDEYPKLVQSADVGVVFYCPQSDSEDSDSIYVRDNIRFIGLSSGKLAYQLQCGIPVLANDMASLKRLTAAYGCGEVTSDTSKTRPGIERILSSYQSYCQNAVKCFQQEFDFAGRFQDVLRALDNLS